MIKDKKRNIGDWLCLCLLFMIVLVLASSSGGDNKADEIVIKRPKQVSEMSKVTILTASLIDAD